MPNFQRDGIEFAFLDEGEGEPILLIHGFGSTKEINWVGPGWVSTLTRAAPPGDRDRQSRARGLRQAL